MKGKFLFVLALAFSISNAQTIKPQELNGEGTYKVTISLKDISRIVCPVEFKTDPVYSKEKFIILKRSGKDIFVKIQPKKYIDQTTREIKSIEYPLGIREAIIKCGDEVFTLIMEPKDVPTQTIYLKPKIKMSKEVKEFEKSNDYEKTLLELIKGAYIEKMPRGYKSVKVSEKKAFKELTMELYKRYVGYFYVVDVYKIVPNKSIEVDEALFLPFIDGKVKALALENLKLEKDKITRLFVIKKNEDIP